MSDAVTRKETLLNAIATGETVDIVPITRKEKYLRYLAGIGEKPSKPITREEMFLDKIQAGGGAGGGDEASLQDNLIDGSITEITSNATKVGHSALTKRTKLQQVNLPLATEVDYYAFADCTSLAIINIPLVTVINGFGFRNCKALISVKLPNVKTIGENAFAECTSLKSIDFLLKVTLEYKRCANCTSLTALILRNEQITPLQSLSSINSSTPIANGTGYIYVPSALIEDYKAATNWSKFATQFRALEDYTVDGTITGELDESKI